jgi:hypothetical protein
MTSHDHDKSDTPRKSHKRQPREAAKEAETIRKPAKDSLGDAISEDAATDATGGPKPNAVW